jgi:kumamolisin
LRKFPVKNFVTVLLAISIPATNPQLAQSQQSGGSGQSSRVTLGESVVQVPAAPVRPGEAVVVRNTLTSAESQSALEFSVVLKMRNLAELKDRIAKNEIVSPSEMAANYFPAAADYQQVAQWLTSQGFSIKPATEDRLSVFATGTVAQIEQVFGTKFGRVNMAGVEYTSALAAPTLPGELAPTVLGINGLQPHLHPHRHFMRAQSLSPQNLSNYGPPYTVSQILQAYNANGLAQNGAGQTIGIVIDTFPNSGDLTSFWSINGINQSLGNIEEVQVVGGALPSPSGEETLDTEWSSSIAPGTKVRIYATTDLSFVHIDEAYGAIINDLPSQPSLRQVSLTYGLGELYEPVSQIQTDSQYFATLAAEGVTIFVSSGDGGATPGPNGPGDNTGPLQVESPACDPSVTAVGGTTLYLNTSTGARVSESAWYLSGGGQSVVFGRPAWQTGADMPSGSGRLVPDVASVADPNTGAYLFLNGSLQVVGGTSWGAPCWAGYSARINQGRAALNLSSLGLLGPRIYALNPISGKPDFFDITTGNNGHYSALPGFDLCTGLGTPNVAQLLASLTKIIAKDLVGDGQADIVVENTLTGQRGYWALNNGQYSYGVFLPTEPTQWHIAGVGDFLGNGQSDLVWENLATGECGIWILNNGVYAYTIPLPTVSTEWQIVGAADFLGTGQADLVWENTATGERGIWILHNGVYAYTIALPTVPTQWHIAGAADFLGTGQAGLVWENMVTGQRGIWILNNGAYAYSINLPTVPVQWQIGGAADFLGTGQAGLAWENTSTGQCALWILNSGNYAYSIYLPTVPAGWQIVDH